jgi:hypothetical protein
MLIDSNPTIPPVTFTGHGENVSVTNYAIGGFIVTLNGHTNEANNTNGVLQLIADITGGGPTETLTILLTDTDFRQHGSATFAENVTGNIIGPGSVTFQSFFDLSDTAFSTVHATSHLSLLGPYPPAPPDASFSGSNATMVTDSSNYSMTLDSTVTGGDVTFTFTATNTPGH